MNNWRKKIIICLGVWLLFSTSLATILTLKDPVARAVMAMGWGLIIFWIIIGGSLAYRWKDRIKEIVLKIPLDWKIKFFLFAALMALIEEAITTTMTNLAPLFGLRVGQAYITASTNFIDVVLFHSAISFLGLFAFWALALKRYDFSPFSVFIVFGITGVFAEVGFGGASHFLEFGLWIFVYGLMVFLPAYTLPSAQERGALIKPKFYHYLIMIFAPILFVPLFAWIPYVLDQSHAYPAHFPPIS